MESRLRALTHALCSCDGRAPGTPQGAAARALIVDALRAAGLAPELQSVATSAGVNVIARAGAGGPRAVLLGAHYDHLGPGFPGADDNAAAVALLLEAARGLAAAPPAEGEVLLCAFDAEEAPHFMTAGMGAVELARRPPVPLERIELAIILDLVGHAVGGDHAPPAVRHSLFVLGAEKSAGTAALIDAAAAEVDGVIVRHAGIDVMPPLSDYEPFRRAGVPFLFLTCGRWRHYHSPTDTPDRIDYRKLAAVTRLTLRVLRAALAPGRARPRYREAARAHAATTATLLSLARALAPVNANAASAARTLEAIQARLGRRGEMSVSDWSMLVQLAALLEQGLA